MYGLDRDWELDVFLRVVYLRIVNECIRVDRLRVDFILVFILRRRFVDVVVRIWFCFLFDEGLGLFVFIKVIRLFSIRSSFYFKDGWLYYFFLFFELMIVNGIFNFGFRVFCYFFCKYRE